MARITKVIQRIKRGYKVWMESGEQSAFIVWVLILTLLWIGLTKTV